MDWSSNNNTQTFTDIQSPQPHKKRKISSQKTEAIHYASRHSLPHKTLKSPTPPPHPRVSKATLSLKEQVEPWWIGQRIVIQIRDAKQTKHTIGRNASIRDYDPSKRLTHIWYENTQNSFENTDLTDLNGWDVATNEPLYEQIEFVPDNDWMPLSLEMGQRVSVRFDGKYGKGLQFTAFVDGYDPISRRHHINYGDTTEWIWATKQRVHCYQQKCADYIETKRQHFKNKQYRILPPPWNPHPYGLDATFAEKSKEIEQQRKHSSEPCNPVSSTKKINIVTQTDATRKKIFGNKIAFRKLEQMHVTKSDDSHQGTSRLMKTVRCVNVDKMMSSNLSQNIMSKKPNHKTRHRKKPRSGLDRKNGQEKTDVVSIKSWSSTVDSNSRANPCHIASDTESDTLVSKRRGKCRQSQSIFTKKSRIKSKNKENSAEQIQVSVTTNIVVTNNTASTSSASSNSSASSTKTKSVSSSKKKKISLRIPKKSLQTHLRNMSMNAKINQSKSSQVPVENTLRTSSKALIVQLPKQNTKCTADASSIDDDSNQSYSIKTDDKRLLKKPLKKPSKQSLNVTLTSNTHHQSKYPRKPIINGQQWRRHYSKNDRKYYWLLPNDSDDIVAKEWDPWRIHGEKAPWMMSMQKWGKFMDTKKGEYYYNYETKESTFHRPRGFESDAEIEYDSSDSLIEL